MRDLSIKTADGIILVYSISSAKSLDTVKARLKEIAALKDNVQVIFILTIYWKVIANHCFQKLPIVVVGNKSDMATRREINSMEVEKWIMNDYPDFK